MAVAEPTGEGDPAPRFDFYASTTSLYYAPVTLGIWCANWETGCEALAIPGHLAVLDVDHGGEAEPAELPSYDVSWVAGRSA